MVKEAIRNPATGLFAWALAEALRICALQKDYQYEVLDRGIPEDRFTDQTPTHLFKVQ